MFKMTLSAALFSVATFAGMGIAQADDVRNAFAGPHRHAITPHTVVGPNVQPVAPAVAPIGPAVAPVRFGISGHFGPNGFHIQHVACNTPASRIGLEPGDVLIRVNGMHPHCQNSLQQALLLNNGWLNLLVQDVRTGRYVTVRGSLYGGGHGGHGGNHSF